MRQMRCEAYTCLGMSVHTSSHSASPLRCSPHHYYRQPTPLLQAAHTTITPDISARAASGAASLRQPTPLLQAAHTTITGSPYHYYRQPTPLLQAAHTTTTCRLRVARIGARMPQSPPSTCPCFCRSPSRTRWGCLPRTPAATAIHTAPSRSARPRRRRTITNMP